QRYTRGVLCGGLMPDILVRPRVLEMRVSSRKAGAHFCGRRARQVMMFQHRFAAPMFFALLSALAISASGARAQTTVTSEPPASFSLDNGLKVVVIPDHRTPVVTQMI